MICLRKEDENLAGGAEAYEVVGQRVMAKYDIGNLAISVRYEKSLDDSPKG